MRLRALVSAAALVAAALLVPAPAQALEQDEVFDVQLSAKDFRIKKGGCQDIPYTVTHSQGVLDSFSLASYVYRGGRELSFTHSRQEDSAGPLRATWYWCSSLHGPGTFTLKKNSVRWNLDEDQYVSGQFVLTQELKQTLKQDSRAKVSRVSKGKGKISLTTKVTHFDTADYRQAQWQGSEEEGHLPRGQCRVQAHLVGDQELQALNHLCDARPVTSRLPRRPGRHSFRAGEALNEAGAPRHLE